LRSTGLRRRGGLLRLHDGRSTAQRLRQWPRVFLQGDLLGQCRQGRRDEESQRPAASAWLDDWRRLVALTVAPSAALPPCPSGAAPAFAADVSGTAR